MPVIALEIAWTKQTQFNMTPFFRLAFCRTGVNFSWGKELLTEITATSQKKTFSNIEKGPSKYKFIFILIFAAFPIYYDRVRANQLIEV